MPVARRQHEEASPPQVRLHQGFAVSGGHVRSPPYVVAPLTRVSKYAKHHVLDGHHDIIRLVSALIHQAQYLPVVGTLRLFGFTDGRVGEVVS